MSDEGRCSNLILSLKLEVAYALQGPLVRPQAKVVGAVLTTGPPKLSPPTGCIGVLCASAREHEFHHSKHPEEGNSDSVRNNSSSNSYANVKSSNDRPIFITLMSSVIFLDVSPPSAPLYPQPPRVDLKLPYDFFYPYLPVQRSNAAESAYVHRDIILMMIMTIMILKFVRGLS